MHIVSRDRERNDVAEMAGFSYTALPLATTPGCRRMYTILLVCQLWTAYEYYSWLAIAILAITARVWTHTYLSLIHI